MSDDRKEAEKAKLLADGWLPEDLTWTPVGAAVAVELVYLRGQEEAEEIRKALDKSQSGQWVIKASAVERRIRSMQGCENYSLSAAMSALPSFLAVARGSRGAKP